MSYSQELAQVPSSLDAPVAEVPARVGKVGSLRQKRARDDTLIETKAALKSATLDFVETYQAIPAYKLVRCFLAQDVPMMVRAHLDSVITLFHCPDCKIPNFFLPNAYFCNVILRVCNNYPGMATATLNTRAERCRSRYKTGERFESVYKIEVSSLDALVFMFGKAAIAPRPWFDSMMLSGYNGGERPADAAAGGRFHIIASRVEPFVMEYVVHKQEISMKFRFEKARWVKSEAGDFVEESMTAPFGTPIKMHEEAPRDPMIDYAMPKWIDEHMSNKIESAAKRRKGEETVAESMLYDHISRDNVLKFVYEAMSNKPTHEIKIIEERVRAAIGTVNAPIADVNQFLV